MIYFRVVVAADDDRAKKVSSMDNKEALAVRY
jgi:hypothetical protein